MTANIKGKRLFLLIYEQSKHWQRGNYTDREPLAKMNSPAAFTMLISAI